MNCQLPATGGGDLGVVVLVAATLIVLGTTALLIVRRSGPHVILPVLIGFVIVIGVTAPDAARAADDCVTTTASVGGASGSSAPATTGPTTAPTPATTSPAPTTAPATTTPTTTTTTSTTLITTTTTAPTTTTSTTSTTAPPTTIPNVAFCGTLIPTGSPPDQSVDVYISLQGGAGTYSVTVPASGNCDGQQQVDAGLAVDSTYFDPAAYCADNAPGSTVNQAAASGAWTPPVPNTYYGCAVN